MNKVLSALFILISLNAIQACKKTVVESSTKTKTGTGQLVLTILKKKNNSVELAVINANVKLYVSEYDRSNNGSTYKLSTTDSNGVCRFSALEKDLYYAIVSHTSYGSMKQIITVQQSAIGYNTYVYP
jgi:hypothetical protein